MSKRKVVLITDGDKMAQKAVEVVAKNIGGRCISLSGGNPTPVSGEELVALIKMAAYDPVLVMFDDCGVRGEGKGEEVLRHVATHPEIHVLGAIAVASNCVEGKAISVDLAIDLHGNIVHHGVDKIGNEQSCEPLRISGDTLGVLNEIEVPIIIGVGDIGKMKKMDSWEIGAPVTTKAVELILVHHQEINKIVCYNQLMMRILAVVTAILSYIMLLMGAIVTKTGSGKGCGSSWPFCHGQLIPESFPVPTVIEYSHRIISGGVGFLILLLTIASWVMYKENMRIKVLSFLSLFFVVLQGALGALTVVFENVFAKKAALALHFGFSLISFASVVLLTICIVKREHQPVGTLSKSLRYFIWGLLVYTYGVVYTGAFVRHTHATMGCGYEFPLCGNTYAPHLASVAGIHLLHRYAALILWCLVLWFLVIMLRQYSKGNMFRSASMLAFVLITCQAASGVWTVLSGGQVLVALLHTTLIACFFAVLAYICMESSSPRG